MLAVALTFAITCFALGFVMNLLHLARSTALPDRLLAADTLVINGIALIVLYGIRTGSPLSVEAALLLAMTGFISTVALAIFAKRGGLL